MRNQVPTFTRLQLHITTPGRNYYEVKQIEDPVKPRRLDIKINPSLCLHIPAGTMDIWNAQ
ncbi:hypothetical protein FIBSPDRAFT_394108 [Athelia psychrophila]|uniref:Uncharacterized protein n=1 Tax=Athelia psychrophila TaxID=1759441 RepID=A0A166NLV5_9AGAM|nr:hypothetical protein FIBSPDRAFT_394108 [Fibularhizoctonia sp. CBS 109695]